MTSGPSGTNPETRGGGDVTSDVAERLRFEALVNDLAAGFINPKPERVDQAIEDCLRRIVEGWASTGARCFSVRATTWS